MQNRKHSVIFQPMGVRAEAEDGQTLFNIAHQAGVELRSICGERTTCGKCRVIVQRGKFGKEDLISSQDHLSPPNAREREYWQKREQGLIARGEDPSTYRLACQARVHGDVVVMVPEGSQAVQQVVRKAATTRSIALNPSLRKIYLELEKATLANPRGDWSRVKAALLERQPDLDSEALQIDFPVLRALQETVREGEWSLTLTLRNQREVVRVEPGYADPLIGLAIDIGTTTLAGYLCDLQTGAVLATADMMNPQVAYGEDIMSRISFAIERADGLQTLHNSVITALNTLCRRVARQAGLKATEIMELVVVGNSVMHHLFLGLSPRDLGRAPYVPALHDPLEIRARDLGLAAVNSGAYIYTLPLIASFVGADCMGVLLAEAPHEQDENWLIIDVGTNAELVLGSRQRLLCTSTPTGPAFEGAHIENGMRAAPGAIERVEIDDQLLVPRFKVIGSEIWSDMDGEQPPAARGICGSGIIDAVAELYRVGILRPDGRFAAVESPNLRQTENRPIFILATEEQTTTGSPISISQDDVRQIQFAKAPLYVASHYLLQRLGLERPDRILLAGGFGSYIDPTKAMLLGMIPDCPLERVYAVGNSAGDGARIALLNQEKRQEAVELLKHIERIELPIQAQFQDQFMLALSLPHMLDPYPNLEGIAPPRVADPLADRLLNT